MLIYIVRHGETRSNVEGYLQGWSNDPLNEKGRVLAAITGQGMKDIKFDACISSPLLRAKETAEIILRESKNNIPIVYEDRIIEINMGDWEQKKFRPGQCEVNSHEIKMFFTNPFNFSGCPGGENIKQVCERTQSFLKNLIAQDDDKTYLITTHGFALRAMLNFLYDNPSDYWHGHVPYNCAVNIIEAKHGVAKLVADDKIYYNLDEAVDQYAKF